MAGTGSENGRLKAYQPNGRLKAYQPAVLQDIVASAPEIQRAKPTTASLVSPGCAAFSAWEARKSAQRAVLEVQARAKEAAFRTAMQKKQAEAAAAREAQFEGLYNEVLSGLVDGGSGIMTEMQEVLQHSDAVHHARQAALHQQWSSQVFDKIQQRIEAGMARTPIQQLEASLQAASDEYLKATNNRPCFLDMIMASEYDPLQPLNNTIRIQTADLVDPLKRDLLKAQEEKALLTTHSSSTNSGAGAGGCNTLGRATTRPTLEVQRWAAGQINATPYGHCIDASGLYTIKAASLFDLAQKASHLHMDDFSPPLPAKPYKPSKCMVEPPAKGGRKGLFDILQGSCHLEPGVTGGDSWLEQKGKRSVPSPEVAMGRRGLAEVLAHGSSNPYQDGRALDDLWLQPSGKLKVPGPEQLRGREDLTEILQQRSNPYVDGRTLGDAWLEMKGKRRVQPGR